MSGDYRSLVLYHRAAEERRIALQRSCAALTHKCKLLDLENFDWLLLGDRLTDFDEILTQGSWLKVALENVPPHEFGLKLCP